MDGGVLVIGGWSWRGALAALFILVVAAVCVRLGVWQLDRLEERRALNAAIERASAAPAVEVDAVAARLGGTSPPAGEFHYRNATARGSYEDHPPVIIRARGRDGRPGVHVVGAFRTTGGARLPVLRGWLPAADGARPDTLPHPPPGTIELRGILTPVPAASGDLRVTRIGSGDDAPWSALGLDRTVVERAFGEEAVPLLLRATGAGGRALPAPVPAPELDEGPHLSYAVQWFSFAVIFLVGGVVVAWRSGREGRSGGGETPQDQRGVRPSEAERVGHHRLD